MTASDQGFGASTPGLWGSLDPFGYLLRMSVLSVLEGLTGFVLTWRAKDTPSGRFWWVLGLSEPRTSGSESGSWPTAHGMDNEGNPRRNGPTGNELGRAVTGAEWATPNTMTGGQTSRGGERKGELLLGGQVRRSWTTPTQDDAGGRATKYKQGGTSLSAQLQGSARPTPTSGDERSTGAAAYSTESGRHPGTTLTDAANGLWARPQARDWKDSGPTQGARKSPNLGTQAHSFPSPKASDGRSKGTGGTPDHGLDAMARAGLLDQGSHSTSGRSRAWPSPAAQTQEGGPRLEGGAAGRAMLKGTELEPGTYRGVLNSRWVAQLMGYPSDWCELPSDVLDALTAKR